MALLALVVGCSSNGVNGPWLLWFLEKREASSGGVAIRGKEGRLQRFLLATAQRGITENE